MNWLYWARPTPLGRDYLIRIRFRERSFPDTFVEDPDLRALASGRKIPHAYSEVPMRLCLHLPRKGEWQPYMRIDETIVPWTYLWLGYFEEWLLFDDWKGGGEHPVAA